MTPIQGCGVALIFAGLLVSCYKDDGGPFLFTSIVGLMLMGKC